MLFDLLLIGSLVIMLAWFPCCEGGEECPQCSGSGVNAPEAMTAVISGMGDNNCSDCDTHDGTYVCGGFSVLGAQCRWKWTGTGGDCGTYQEVDVIIYYSAPTYNIQGTLYFTGVGHYDTHNWQKVLGASKPDCESFSSESVTFFGSTSAYHCDASSATFTVTSGG